MNESEVKRIAKGEVGCLAFLVFLMLALIAFALNKHTDQIKKLEAAIELINQPKEKE